MTAETHPTMTYEQTHTVNAVQRAAAAWGAVATLRAAAPSGELVYTVARPDEPRHYVVVVVAKDGCVTHGQHNGRLGT